MNVLAIDPGPKVSGWVILEKGSLKVLASGRATPTEGVIEMVDIAASGHIVRDENGLMHIVDDVACEMIASYGMAVGAEVFETCLQIGRICHAWEYGTSGRVTLVKRQEAKMHLCHSPKAKDANVMQALKDKLGEVGTKKNPGPLYGISKHAWAALAVGVYAAETRI